MLAGALLIILAGLMVLALVGLLALAILADAVRYAVRTLRRHGLGR
jgi:hypothetical protein